MLRSALLLLTAGWLTACQQMQTTDASEVGVARPQRMSYLLSEDAVAQTASTGYNATLDQDEAAGTLNSDPALSARVERIARRLIAQVGHFRLDATHWPWEINVETNAELSAYCAPGGKLLVYSGLVTTLQLSDDELAALLAHEIGHALREHLRERMSRAQYQVLGAQIVNAITGMRYDAQLATTLKITNLAYNAPFTRLQETEADAVGVELAARAGFDPRAALTLWQTLAAVDPQHLPQFLSTHPPMPNRLADLQALMPTVLPLYQASQPH